MGEMTVIRARLEAYYSADEIEQWLSSPHPQLEGERPDELIGLGRAAEVRRIIERLDSDGYI